MMLQRGYGTDQHVMATAAWKLSARCPSPSARCRVLRRRYDDNRYPVLLRLSDRLLLYIAPTEASLESSSLSDGLIHCLILHVYFAVGRAESFGIWILKVLSAAVQAMTRWLCCMKCCYRGVWT